MITPHVRLACLVVLMGFAINCPAALGQPKALTACGTTISTPGSYVVTTNLTSASTSVPCIKVTAAPVTLDLDGFVLTGIGGSPGISATSGPLTISNGVITKFNIGINAAVIGVTVSGVQVTSSQLGGAILGDDAQVSDSNFVSNGTSGAGDGLDVGSNALVTRCAFVSNKGNGFRAKGSGAVVTRSRAASNTADGFLTHGNSVLRNDTAIGNTILGFQDQGGGCAFRSDIASGNGNTGFLAFNSALIGNNASGNKNSGFQDEGENTFEGNTAFSNSPDGFVNGSPFSTLVNNTSSINSRYGFDELCPDSLINVTAESNKTANLNLTGTCQLINTLH